MRYALAGLVVAGCAMTTLAEPVLHLRWELKGDVFEGPSDPGATRAAFLLTNRGKEPLPGHGWAIYFSALHRPWPGSAGGGVVIENVTGGLWRMVPGPGFADLLPGDSVQIEYLTGLLTNRSFAPVGPYVVFDTAPEKGRVLPYTAVPFERPPQPPGRDPRVITPQQQFERDAAVADLAVGDLPPVLPTPFQLERREGRLRLLHLPAIAAPPELAAEARLAAEYLGPHLPRRGDGEPVPLRLETGRVEGQSSPEAYELVIDPGAGIRITGASAAGVFYGLQSLRAMLPVGASGEGLSLPALRILDAPRFGYRGLMLDVARNFQPKAEVLRVLDLMARYKLNVLHFHLTEDEAWRLEIAGLPELTSLGARRGHTLDSSRFLPPAYGSGPDPDRPFGSGFYSRRDYVEILRHAAARHVEVIPELEMPGHARAAIMAMEARYRSLMAQGDAEGAVRYRLSDPGDRSVYTSAQGYHDNVINPALDSTYAFVERVVDAVVEVHREAGVPLRHIHMGGDEVPDGAFEGSPAALSFLRQNRLFSVDELWYVFYGRVAEMLQRHGLLPSGWEEIALRKTRLDDRPKSIVNPGFAGRGFRAYVWNNVVGGGQEDLAYRLANGGYPVVLCPVTNLYLDLAWNPNPEETGLDWGGLVDLRKPFEFIPFDYYRNVRFDRRGRPVDPAVFVGKDRLTDYGRGHVLGIQGNLWSETLNAPGELDYKLVPKVFGLAERAWAPEPDWQREKEKARSEALFQKAWSTFVNVVGKRELPRLDREQPPWSYRIPKPGLLVVDGEVRASLEIPGFVLRYTTDGTEPTTKSPEVRGGVPIAPEVRVAAFDSNGRKGHTARLRAPGR
jgi:hexosaminidase